MKTKRAAVAGALLALTTGLLVGTSAPAQASSYNCWTRTAVWQTQAYGACEGSSDYKIAAVCRNGLGWTTYRESAFKGPFWGAAWVTCPLGYTVQSSWMLSRWN